MSSVQSAYSQVAPLKRYVAEVAGEIYDATGNNVVAEVAVRSVLRDMGKTIYLENGNVLRKVQILSTIKRKTYFHWLMLTF